MAGCAPGAEIVAIAILRAMVQMGDRQFEPMGPGYFLFSLASIGGLCPAPSVGLPIAGESLIEIVKGFVGSTARSPASLTLPVSLGFDR